MISNPISYESCWKQMRISLAFDTELRSKHDTFLTVVFCWRRVYCRCEEIPLRDQRPWKDYGFPESWKSKREFHCRVNRSSRQWHCRVWDAIETSRIGRSPGIKSDRRDARDETNAEWRWRYARDRWWRERRGLRWNLDKESRKGKDRMTKFIDRQALKTH